MKCDHVGFCMFVCVYCAVRTGYLHIKETNFVFKVLNFTLNFEVRWDFDFSCYPGRMYFRFKLTLNSIVTVRCTEAGDI